MCGILLNAYLPTTAPKMMEQLGLDASALDLTKTTYGAQETYTVHKGCLLYTSIAQFFLRGVHGLCGFLLGGLRIGQVCVHHLLALCDHVLNRLEPVSYTHLDVYKRQVLWALFPNFP